MPQFTQGGHIFDDQDVLREDYTPDDVVERDDVVAEYIEALDPVINGGKPRHVFVYGDTGVGKTVTTNIVLRDLQEQQDQLEGVNVEVIDVNCSGNTSYQVAVTVINQLRSRDRRISHTGHARSEIMQMFWEELNKLDARQILFVLDEVDSLGEDDAFLYNLLNASSEGHLRDDRYAGVIGICNNFRYDEELSKPVRDRLCELEIYFGGSSSSVLRVRSRRVC